MGKRGWMTRMKRIKTMKKGNHIIRWNLASLQLYHYSNVPFQSNSLALVLMIVLARLMSCLAGMKKEEHTFQLTGFFNEQSRMSFSGCWTQKQYELYYYEIFKVESSRCLSSFISQVSNEKDNISLPMSNCTLDCETKWMWNRSAIISSTRYHSAYIMLIFIMQE